jgi:hypothetical protein
MVVRMFATNTPRFAKWVQSSGAHATARVACARVLTLYGWCLTIVAGALEFAGLQVAADVFFGLVAVCVVWLFVCGFSAVKPQREYRQAKSGASDPAS